MNPDPNQAQDPQQTPTSSQPEGGVQESSPKLSAQPINEVSPYPQLDSTPFKPSKKKPIAIGIVLAVLLLIFAGVIVYFLQFAPSKTDYKQAYDQLQLAHEPQQVAAPGLTESLMTKAKLLYSTFKIENEKLKGMKAFNDPDLSVKYKAYKKDLDTYIAYMDIFSDSCEKLQVVLAARPTGLYTSANVDNLIILTEAAANTAKDPTIKTYLDSTLVLYKDLLTFIKAQEVATTGSQSTQADTAVVNKSKEIFDMYDTLGLNIDGPLNEATPRATYKALNDALLEKTK